MKDTVMEKDKKIGAWKKLMISELTGKLKSSKNLIVSDYLGLAGTEMDEFRRELESTSSRYMVLKNSMAKIALKEAGYEELAKYVTGGTGIVLSGKDPAATAKAVWRFSKSHSPVKVRGGYIEGGYVDSARVNYLAMLPSRKELITKVVYGIKAPISGFVGVLANTLKSLVYAVQAIKDKKGGQNG